MFVTGKTIRNYLSFRSSSSSSSSGSGSGSSINRNGNDNANGKTLNVKLGGNQNRGRWRRQKQNQTKKKKKQHTHKHPLLLDRSVSSSSSSSLSPPSLFLLSSSLTGTSSSSMLSSSSSSSNNNKIGMDKNESSSSYTATDFVDSTNSNSNSNKNEDQESSTMTMKPVVPPTRTTTTTTTTTTEEVSSSLSMLRLHYLVVILTIMLADGLQGTHLYALYDSYGFDVPTLYAIGFLTGAVTTPITNPLIDALGRKKSAIIYCLLEIWINQLEQYPRIWGLVVSRMVGGITTNLLATVFETWLDTEYKRLSIAATNKTKARDENQEEPGDNPKDYSSEESSSSSSSSSSYYETILRDAMIISNVASIGSGYLAHLLAARYGPVGPFQGAVTCTAIALVVVAVVWTENYGNTNASTTISTSRVVQSAKVDTPSKKIPSQGVRAALMDTTSMKALPQEQNSDTPPLSSTSSTCSSDASSSDFDTTGAVENENADGSSTSNVTTKKTVKDYLTEAYDVICNDPRIWKVGLIQGLSAGSIQIFIFLWSPTLATFAKSESLSNWWWLNWALDDQEPAYGLIFGAFMACGVFGGMCAPFLRRTVSSFTRSSSNLDVDDNDDDEQPAVINPCHDQIQVCGIPTTVRPMALELLVALCYTLMTGLLLVSPLMTKTNSSSPDYDSFHHPQAFSYSLLAFLVIEFLIGVTLPCEGVLRSIYIPSAGRATMLILPRIVVNIAVAVGVFLTRYMKNESAFIGIAALMAWAATLQYSFMSRQEWKRIHRRSVRQLRRSISSFSKKSGIVRNDTPVGHHERQNSSSSQSSFRSMSSDVTATSFSESDDVSFNEIVKLQEISDTSEHLFVEGDD